MSTGWGGEPREELDGQTDRKSSCRDREGNGLKRKGKRPGLSRTDQVSPEPGEGRV